MASTNIPPSAQDSSSTQSSNQLSSNNNNTAMEQEIQPETALPWQRVKRRQTSTGEYLQLSQKLIWDQP